MDGLKRCTRHQIVHGATRYRIADAWLVSGARPAAMTFWDRIIHKGTEQFSRLRFANRATASNAGARRPVVVHPTKRADLSRHGSGGAGESISIQSKAARQVDDLGLAELLEHVLKIEVARFVEFFRDRRVGEVVRKVVAPHPVFALQINQALDGGGRVGNGILPLLGA